MADLTTLANVKASLAIAANQTGSDAVLGTLITATSADFLQAIGRADFLEASYVEVREGDGGSRMTMRHWPIVSIASITVAGVGLAVSADRVQPGFYFEAELDAERRTQVYLAGGSVFADGASVAIDYTAGYAASPADVDQAIVDWVSVRYKGRPGTAIASQRDAGGEHVTYEKESSMPPTTAGVVERYLRSWPSLDRRKDDLAQRVTRINRNYTIGVKTQ